MLAIDVIYGPSGGLGESNIHMSEKPLKRYLFASDFDQTLTFDDSGYVLSELVGIPTAEFERKAQGMAKLNLVQQGAELSYLLLHDPEFRKKVRKQHLYEVGKNIRLKENIELLYQVLKNGVDGYHFDFYVISASPVEVIQSALEGIVPRDHIYGTEFVYNAAGEIESLVRATAGYGKVAALDQLQAELQIGPDHIIYTGDGSSDINVMLHVKMRDGFTIAVSEAKHISQVARAHRPQHQRPRRSGTHPRRNGGLGARANPPVLRVLRNFDPGMGQRAHRLAYPAAGGQGSSPGGNRERLNPPPCSSHQTHGLFQGDGRHQPGRGPGCATAGPRRK